MIKQKRELSVMLLGGNICSVDVKRNGEYRRYFAKFPAYRNEGTGNLTPSSVQRIKRLLDNRQGLKSVSQGFISFKDNPASRYPVFEDRVDLTYNFDKVIAKPKRTVRLRKYYNDHVEIDIADRHYLYGHNTYKDITPASLYRIDQLMKGKVITDCYLTHNCMTIEVTF